MIETNHTLLIVSLLAITAGPLLHHLFTLNRRTITLADRIVFIVVGGLVVFHLAPHSFEKIGYYSIPLLGVGAMIPVLIEKGRKTLHHKAHRIALFIICSGIFLHALLDGMALMMPGEHTHKADFGLPLAIILHRFPVGLMLWMLLQPTYGIKTAASLILVICIATVIGFFMYQSISSYIPLKVAHGIYAIVSGSLFHILYHRQHYPDHQH